MRTFLLFLAIVLAAAPASADSLKAIVAKQITAPIQISSCRASRVLTTDRSISFTSSAPVLIQSSTPGGTYVAPGGAQYTPVVSYGFPSTSVQPRVSFKNISSVPAEAVGFAFQLFDPANRPIKTFTALLEGSFAPNSSAEPTDAHGNAPWNISTLNSDVVATVSCSIIYAKFANGTVWGAIPK